jgi:hypothetical protein
MRQFLFIILLFFYQVTLGQYTIDTSLHTQYWTVFERFPDIVKKEKEKHFKNGLGILTGIKTDTINKNEYSGMDHPDKIQPGTNTNQGKVFSQNQKESVSEFQPMWISCICKFKGDTLEIIDGLSVFSGFDVTTSLFKDKAKAFYTEYESENVFKTNLANEKVSEFSIPATINNLILDRQPKKGAKEIYGKMIVTSNGYYSYLNAGDFKNGYVHKRLRLQYYFRCDILN